MRFRELIGLACALFMYTLRLLISESKCSMKAIVLLLASLLFTTTAHSSFLAEALQYFSSYDSQPTEVLPTETYPSDIQQVYFSWLYDSQPGEAVPSHLMDAHTNLYFGKERHVLTDDLKNYVASSPLYVVDGVKYGYKRFDGEANSSYFDGVSYFVGGLWNKNRNLFPNKLFVPILVSDITIFVESKGKIPISYASPYVERSIVKHQIEQLLGRSWIYGYSSPDMQIKALFDNALEFSDAHDLYLGQELSYHHQYLISKDIIWPVVRVVNGKSMLLPIVYLSRDTLGQEVDANTIAFGSANLSYNTVNIDGTEVNVQRDLVVNARQVILTNSIVTAGSIDLEVGSNIELLSTQISANQVKLSADRISNRTLVTRYSFEYDNSIIYNSPIWGEITVPELGSGYHDSASQLGFIESFGDITITAREDFINQGANLSAQGAIVIEAGNNIAIITQPIESYTYFENSYWSDRDSSIQQILSQLSAEEIILLANNSILLEAATLEAKGTIQLLAGMGIHLVESVNSISSEENFEYKSGGLFGSSESESDSFEETELLRTVISAGKSVVIRTVYGNIVLRAVKLDTEGTASIVSDEGLVSMQIAKTIDFQNYEYYAEDLMVFNTQGYGHFIETGYYNELMALGGVTVDAGKGIKIEYFGEDSLDETIDKLSNVPELQWMADFRNNPNVNWITVDLAYEEWDYEASGLTEVGAIIVAIAVSAVMPGSEAFLSAALGNASASASVAVAMSAGATSLATQAASALVANGGDPLKAMQQMGDNFDVRALATAMATAGMMDYIGGQTWFQDLTVSDAGGVADSLSNAAEASNVVDTVSFVGQAQDVAVRALTQATVSSGMSYVLQGGNLEDLGDSFLVSLGQNTVNLIGKKLAQEIGDAKKGNNPIETSTQYMAHAALGCVIGTASSAVTNGGFEGVDNACASGAGGGVIGEFVAQQIRQDFFDDSNGLLKDKKLTLDEYQAMYYSYKSFGVDMAKLAAALTAHSLGGNVQIASDVGANAAENNAFWFLAIPAFIAAEKAWTLYEYATWVEALGVAIKNEDDTEVERLLQEKSEELLLDIVISGVPGSKVMAEIADAIAKINPNAVEAIKDLLDYSAHLDAGTASSIVPGRNSRGMPEPDIAHYINPDVLALPKPRVPTDKDYTYNADGSITGPGGGVAYDTHLITPNGEPIFAREGGGYYAIGADGFQITDIPSPRLPGSTKLSDHVWSEDPVIRGEQIERYLTDTDYAGWQNTNFLRNPATATPEEPFGALVLNGENFPLIDFQRGLDVVSLKTVDTNGLSWRTRMADHAKDLNVRSITVDGVAAIKTLDIRVQPGGFNAAQQWADSVRARYPRVTINVGEFRQP